MSDWRKDLEVRDGDSQLTLEPNFMPLNMLLTQIH